MSKDCTKSCLHRTSSPCLPKEQQCFWRSNSVGLFHLTVGLTIVFTQGAIRVSFLFLAEAQRARHAYLRWTSPATSEAGFFEETVSFCHFPRQSALHCRSPQNLGRGLLDIPFQFLPSLAPSALAVLAQQARNSILPRRCRTCFALKSIRWTIVSARGPVPKLTVVAFRVLAR